MPVEGYAVNWTAVVIAAVIGTAAMGVMILGSVLLAPHRPSVEKFIPYESGIRPTPLAWTQFTVRYYIFAILFLIFDVEAVFLFPWALIFNLPDVANFVFWAMILFVAILLFGVAYAWRKGVLEWR